MASTPTTPDASVPSTLAIGTFVKVTQQIAARNYTWVSETVGEVVEFKQKPTGSWYAHSKGEKLWLDRLVLKLKDGEITTLNLDEYSVVEILKAS